MLSGDQHKKNENARVVAQWASLFQTCREIKSINAVTPRLLVIRDILRFNNLKGESELDGSLELTWGSGGGYLSLGGVSQVVVHPLGVLFVLGGTNLPL